MYYHHIILSQIHLLGYWATVLFFCFVCVCPFELWISKNSIFNMNNPSGTVMSKVIWNLERCSRSRQVYWCLFRCGNTEANWYSKAQILSSLAFWLGVSLTFCSSVIFAIWVGCGLDWSSFRCSMLCLTGVSVGCHPQVPLPAKHLELTIPKHLTEIPSYTTIQLTLSWQMALEFDDSVHN